MSAPRNVRNDLRHSLHSAFKNIKFNVKSVLTSAMYNTHKGPLHDILSEQVSVLWKRLHAAYPNWDVVRFYLKGGTAIRKIADILNSTTTIAQAGSSKALLDVFVTDSILTTHSDWDCAMNISPLLPPPEFQRVYLEVTSILIDFYASFVRSFQAATPDLTVFVPTIEIIDVVESRLSDTVADIVALQNATFGQPTLFDPRAFREGFVKAVDFSVLPVSSPVDKKLASLHEDYADAITLLIALRLFVDPVLVFSPCTYYSTFSYAKALTPNKREVSSTEAGINRAIEGLMDGIVPCKSVTSTRMEPLNIQYKIKYNTNDTVSMTMNRTISSAATGRRLFDLFRIMQNYQTTITFNGKAPPARFGERFLPAFVYNESTGRHDRVDNGASPIELGVNPGGMVFDKLISLNVMGFQAELVDVSTTHPENAKEFTDEAWSAQGKAHMTTVGTTLYPHSPHVYPIASLSYFIYDVFIVLSDSSAKMKKRCERLYIMLVLRCMFYGTIDPERLYEKVIDKVRARKESAECERHMSELHELLVRAGSVSFRMFDFKSIGGKFCQRIGTPLTMTRETNMQVLAYWADSLTPDTADIFLANYRSFNAFAVWLDTNDLFTRYVKRCMVNLLHASYQVGANAFTPMLQADFIRASGDRRFVEVDALDPSECVRNFVRTASIARQGNATLPPTYVFCRRRFAVTQRLLKTSAAGVYVASTSTAVYVFVLFNGVLYNVGVYFVSWGPSALSDLLEAENE